MFGKDSLVYVFFQPPFNHVRMGLKHGTLPYQGKKSPQPVLNLSPCVGIAFPVSDLTLLCSFVLLHCVTQHLPNPTVISVPCGEGTGSFWSSTKRPWAGYLPWISCQVGPTHYGIRMPTTKASSVSSLYECLTAVWFFCNFDTKMQWAQIFGLLFLLIGNRCLLLYSASFWA